MKHALLWTLIISLTASCTKNPPVTPVPIDTPIKDIQTIRLKDVIESELPSPYYRFVYTDSGYISHINFASNLVTYEISYKDQRIHQMVNTRVNEHLTYYYANESVKYITLHNAVGNKLRSYAMTYDNNKRLTEVKWYVFEQGMQDSVLERKVRLLYDPNGNLQKKEEFRVNANGEFQFSSATQYEQYDNGINIDDRYLLKDYFMEHLLLLPQVKLQKNNPRLVTIINEQKTYRINYNYTYQNNLPVIKAGRMEQTSGEGTGGVFQFTHTYSYY